MLVYMSVIYFDNISLFLTDKKFNCVLVRSSIFYYSKKWIKATISSFVQKIWIKWASIFEILTMAWRVYYEQNINSIVAEPV